MNNKVNKPESNTPPIHTEILDQLIEQLSAVAALDFSVKNANIKGDGTPLDTIALGLNMLCEELEDRVVGTDELEEKNRELESVISRMNDFQYALDSSSIVVIIDIKGTIVYVNDKFCEISKYSRKELVGQSSDILDSGFYSIDFWKDVWQTIEQGKVWSGETKERAKDGSTYWVTKTIVPFLSPNGKPYKYMFVNQDITLSKELEQRIISSMIYSQEKDREVLAEDLHEGIAQSLAALMLQVDIIESKIQDISDDTLKKSVDFIKSYINESIENTRVLATKLMPRTMMKYGVEPSLRAYILRLQQNNRQIIDFNSAINKPIDKGVEITIYRVIVALLDMMYSKYINRIIVDLNASDSILISVHANLIDSSKLILDSSINDLAKRVEFHGGEFRIDDSIQGKIIVNIKL